MSKTNAEISPAATTTQWSWTGAGGSSSPAGAGGSSSPAGTAAGSSAGQQGWSWLGSGAGGSNAAQVQVHATPQVDLI